MHQKNREKKYYQIRVEWLWGMIFLLTVLSAAELYGILKYFRQNRTEAAPEEGQMRVEVTYDGGRSRLDDTNQCHLCGDSSRIRCESGFDAIGVISLNDWSVIDFQLRKYDTEGNDVTDDRASGILYGNTEALSWLSSGDPSRGMARISMTLPEDARADEDGICRSLCQPCLDKVTASLSIWKSEKEDKEALPLCLVDFQDLELYPIQDWYRGYFIRDYWMEMDFEQSSVSVKAYFLPVLVLAQGNDPAAEEETPVFIHVI